MNYSGGSDNNVLEPVGNRKTFFSHVFSTTEEGKAELLNTTQYALLGIVPVILLNKLIQRFIPDADADKSSVEILIEVLIQLIVMFIGVIIIHRIITFIPTYSEFKYESLSLTNVILAFMILVLSIQTKIGIKVNILVDRTMELWTGVPRENMEGNQSKSRGQTHQPQVQQQLITDTMGPPNPQITRAPGQQQGPDIRAPPMPMMDDFMPANGANIGGIGSSFF